jgi:hypothetical protein
VKASRRLRQQLIALVVSLFLESSARYSRNHASSSTIGLRQSGIPRQMLLRMLAATIGRIEEHGRWGIRPASGRSSRT